MTARHQPLEFSACCPWNCHYSVISQSFSTKSSILEQYQTSIIFRLSIEIFEDTPKSPTLCDSSKSKKYQQRLQSNGFLSREILDHIRCIKQENLVQKQVLIPIILAVGETGDESDRPLIREYCTNWSSRSRCDMIETAQIILENIWAGWEEQTRDVYWWGETVTGGSWAKVGRIVWWRCNFYLDRVYPLSILSCRLQMIKERRSALENWRETKGRKPKLWN